ncbi:tRNA (adenosine(37)-N6)-threonylcarbamoyltransferase complex dimerization subunit type 1 TsaB [Candidatus Woesebacteria bacterium RIFCSPHIGHO2_01_FULL_39_32]|uniref:Glycoprotein endopeptidase n=2 Tax=Candidatus Woeseibacteriota TaxID=1752722 RepID=A0A0G0SXY0_9BACT|nr:MAG: Glycoprotein endopeptidase [Candidatus Woesebacteria bacterium GW2011_GWA1_39_8]OGM25258.1 MAG: tRNA (adenosine(37)-N6)-threonylcarbamoyltransferase complex dimerization subunit type 1 TsaB [Candidatus Woesebacteria bacterium RIFCSPHIGHO2_01_FULL_39_32]OGM37758.1 MAG: tRNA (adenosine(37)-N6)-threonylcarbamoyltransferase complex dimerization subunit type 1 TsaB [Candidatus Woesebacteria bacterium RIFCSPHIGHO2_12_FULL_38_11]OGM64789.1 MAG: tRNA (adenosine(37)-N6)-threonylcarbamoyltransfera
MKLYIDTSDTDKIILGINDKKFETNARNEKSQKLLTFLEEVLKKENFELADIREIKVHTGPGSFTGLRVGISVANTLGWTLGVPVNGKDLSKGEMTDLKYE